MMISRPQQGTQRRAHWSEDAACGQKPNLADDPDSLKQLCQYCPVIDECLEDAMSDSSLVGIWGGTTERQRHKIRSARKDHVDDPSLSPRVTARIARDRRVVELRHRGAGSNQIAEAIGITPRTVRRVLKAALDGQAEEADHA